MDRHITTIARIAQQPGPIRVSDRGLIARELNAMRHEVDQLRAYVQTAAAERTWLRAELNERAARLRRNEVSM
jgi:hypothetical protein